MSRLNQAGTIVRGSVTLTNAAPGPTTLYTVPAGEYLYVETLLVSTNDTANPLVTFDDGGATLTKTYATTSAPTSAVIEGPIRVKPGKTLRASTPAVSATKTVEILFTGYVSKT